MDVKKVLEVQAVITDLGRGESPLKLTMARCQVLAAPTVSEFTKAKEDKFNDLVRLNENGNPVPTAALVEAVKAGKIKPNQDLPFEAYEFETEDGLKELKDFIIELNAKPVSIIFPTVKLSKKIRLKDGEDIELGELLEAADSSVNTQALVVLMEAGIIIE